MLEPTRFLDMEQEGYALSELIPSGTQLHGGNYIVMHSLGRGGFGITYLARDLQLERDVVIKECFPESICYRDGLELVVRTPNHAPHFRKCVEMFVREARSIARLAHPNIVNVYAIFEENQTAYMVLDLIEGSDLLDLIDEQRKSFAPQEIQSILTDMLGALTVVHDQNLLHRDISPDNILLDANGRPTLIDFGSAREFASERGKQTTSLLFVKDGYSPFEFYVRGAAHSPASDLYALGGTIYHLVSGEPPPSSQLRHAELQAEHADPCVPLAGRFRGYPPGFLEAIDKSLSLSPSKRIQTTRDWLKLLAAQDGLEKPQTQQPQSAPRSKLGDLVSQTNKEVLGEKAAERPKPAFFDPFAIDLGPQPAWRDDFNRETEELMADAQGAAFDDTGDAPLSDDAPPTPVAERPASPQFDVEPDETAELAQAQIAAYYRSKGARAPRSGVSNSPAIPYIIAALIMIFIASAFAPREDSLQADGSRAERFAPPFLCNNEFIMTYLPLELNCDQRATIRRIEPR